MLLLCGNSNWHSKHIKLSQSFKKLFIYLLFIFGVGGGAVLGLCCCKQTFFTCNKWRLFSSCRVWASHCGGFSCCRLQALECLGSVVVAHGFSCPLACGIFPDQGSNLCPLHQQVDSQLLDHQGSPVFTILKV